MKTIFYDVDTQNDFMNATGALYVPEAENIKENLKQLTEYAQKSKIDIVGSLDLHFGTDKYKDKEGELASNGGAFPPHCMTGTEGQKKIAQTNTKGTFFEKQSYDIFTNDKFEKYLKKQKIEKAVIYGVATDFCVKAAVLGMLKLGIVCYVVEDAIKGVFPDKTVDALNEMTHAGAKFITTAQAVKGEF